MTKHIEHFGVLGMRWGHRKQKDTTTKKSKSNRILNALAIAAAIKYLSILGRVGFEEYVLSPDFKVKYKKAKAAYEAYKSIKLPANVDKIIKPLIIEGKFK